MPQKTSKGSSGQRRRPDVRRTTVALPARLLDAADRAVRAGKARSRTDLLSRALQRELAAQRRNEIDAAFLEMANDPEYQADALLMAVEATVAGWEALQLGERNDPPPPMVAHVGLMSHSIRSRSSSSPGRSVR